MWFPSVNADTAVALNTCLSWLTLEEKWCVVGYPFYNNSIPQCSILPFRQAKRAKQAKFTFFCVYVYQIHFPFYWIHFVFYGYIFLSRDTFPLIFLFLWLWTSKLYFWLWCGQCIKSSLTDTLWWYAISIIIPGSEFPGLFLSLYLDADIDNCSSTN